MKRLIPKTERWRTVWVVLLLGFAGLIALATFGIIFLKRAVIDYRSEHDFTTRDPAFFASAHAMADPLPIEGNSVKLLHNGDEIFPAMLEAIRAGKASINFEAFLFQPDEVGTKFRDALCERARAGVRVRVLLDGMGAKLRDEDVAMFQQAGCALAIYHKMASWRVDKLNRRTHRRVLVIDGKVGFTGGAGFAKEWAGNADAPEHWREVHARLEGPIVAKLQGAFQQHWARETGETISGLADFPPLPPVGKLRTQLIASHSFSISPISLVQAVAFSSAEKTICITNAYCAPSNNQVELLTAAASRGVDVRVLLPGRHNDQPMTKSAGRGAYGRLLEGGVKIYEYEPTMIHTKTIVVDGIFSVLGSSNFDSRSAQINEELDITIYDEGFGTEMDAVFQRDLEQSKPYLLEEFKKRPLSERLSEWIVLPLSPLL